MAKLIGNVAILMGGSIVMLATLLAVGILFCTATLIVVGRRLNPWRASIEAGDASQG